MAARAHFVRRARKCPKRGSGIYKGDSYWWWQFRHGPKIVSKIKPRRAQLTRSSFLSAIYDLEDRVAAISTLDEARDYVESAKGTLDELLSECEASLEALPENLREVTTGSILQERIEGLQSWLDALGEIELGDREPDDEDDEDVGPEPDLGSIIEQLQQCNSML